MQRRPRTPVQPEPAWRRTQTLGLRIRPPVGPGERGGDRAAGGVDGQEAVHGAGAGEAGDVRAAGPRLRGDVPHAADDGTQDGVGVLHRFAGAWVQEGVARRGGAVRVPGGVEGDDLRRGGPHVHAEDDGGGRLGRHD